MKSIARSLALTAITTLALTTFIPGAHAQFSYTFYPNDATINSEISTDFAIVGYASGSYDENFAPNFVGASSPTIQVVDGAAIDVEMDVFNHSAIHILGGDVSALVAYDTTTVDIRGGLSGLVLSIAQSAITMSGGYVSDLEGQGKSITMTGGIVDTLVANTQTDAPGNTLGSCIVDVTGGTIGELDAFNDGILNLRGGLPGESLYAAFGGTFNIYGVGLTATLIDPAYNNRYSKYSLSGRLADGTLLTNKNLYIENEGVTYGHSSFKLVAVPEPGSLALLGLTLPIAGLLRRRKA